MQKRGSSKRRKRIGGKMSDPEKTEPGFAAKAKKAAKQADPWADRALYAIKGSEYSAVIIGVIVVALIGFGLWLAKG